ncbi:hypothetical protein [Halorubrum sp. Atlit-28R]|uniref:hypothetical protein n=1 Tax=Halorubrum sp. Atlit-28R TaxID=2282129 RepID=UPI0011C3C8CE|nr:hypothetical protein [Halorubrum sp. Atlit-28R]
MSRRSSTPSLSGQDLVSRVDEERNATGGAPEDHHVDTAAVPLAERLGDDGFILGRVGPVVGILRFHLQPQRLVTAPERTFDDR